MSTMRRPLGHGPQPQPPAVTQQGAGSARRVSAAEADIDVTPLYRPGGLEHLAQLRERGVLGPSSETPGQDGPAR
ncbi:hypothetical protein ACWY4P_04120 [Streptomyces sp. LZ34]